MNAVDLQALYDRDPRPTFVVDCDARPVIVSFVNKALLNTPSLASSIHFHDAFRDWWDPDSRVAAAQQEKFRHGRLRWIKFPICKRWLVVSLLEEAKPAATETHGMGIASRQIPRTTAPVQPAGDDIFNIKVQSLELREHIKFVREVDWGATPLGPIARWSPEMLHVVTVMMLETRPTALFLGNDNNIIYNVAYAKIAGSRHPQILGLSIIDGWHVPRNKFRTPEVADPVNATIARSQENTYADAPEEEYHFMIERFGYVEEAFFLWSLVPLVGPVKGLYSIVTEVTEHRLLERRVNTLSKIGQLTNGARDIGSFWTSIKYAIKPYEYDIPTAILYSASELDAASSVHSGKSTGRKCTLEWTIGYAKDCAFIPVSLDLEKDEGLGRALVESAKQTTPVLFRKEDGILPAKLFEEVEQRAFGDPCKAFIVFPFKINDESISGFLILGLNTRRPYDLGYQQWIEVFANLLSNSAASVALYEEEFRNRRRIVEQAAMDRAALNAEVAVLTQEAIDVTARLQSMYDVVDKVGVGFFEYNMEGKLINANNAFFEQSGFTHFPSESSPPFSFAERTFPADLEKTMSMWHTLASGEPVKFDMRWKREPRGPEDPDDFLWIQSACFPIKSSNGSVTSIAGCNVNVSVHKRATKAALLRAEAEKRLATFTEISPVAFFQLNNDLNLTYCNDIWFEITGHPRSPEGEGHWQSVVLPEELPQIHRDIDIIFREQKTHQFSFRLKKQWKGPDGVSCPTWILATATPELDEHGKTISMIGALNDVSHLKWAEHLQRVRVDEALESKRQQENFIDMTSHEMRNPLSAMVQCADSISSSLHELGDLVEVPIIEAQSMLQHKIKDLLETSLDAIDTIQACATHQKRIVDDILTLSKLDSKLLVICPITAQPSVLLRDTYKMFKDEANKAGVSLEVRSEESISDLKVDWAIIDPSRVLQILINLITNAIKFTQTQEVRKVEVIMGASLQPEKKPGFDYVPQETKKKDFLEKREWGDGDVFYLHFTVIDTGCGLTAEHKAKLFLRFSQATPKTHVQYGGSGLGLFISREMSELQGGSIGVQSEPTKGSTFSFYIKSRHASPPSSYRPNVLPNHTKAEIIQHTTAPGSDSPFRLTSTLTSLSSTPPPSANQIFHILVVEDNLINQRVLTSQLIKRGHKVLVANHGREALSQLHKTHFSTSPQSDPPFPLSVVLMDVEMPVMDGLTCTRKIREMEREREIVGHVPIIAVSANARHEQIEMAKQAGMDDAISKPFRIPELLEMVGRLTRGEA
ncbi:hypothetical protein B0J11DRAFT_442335 [Dendryphion nanum]|uniref:Histidine kinase n=1 Tax=Dendryphion nanum TaxID=256645 RepID=A0A9P9DDP6_9PLEO|nr:hypothetical protein B0J11DRAFT_442335 [Dendryphion nanum]